ncbi:ATP-binding protein [Allomuricauda sp. d1]|uniref:hybrid sensor histidine kinase/response regulator n=1 Tax=Allomuricauda sp. d1 TaxID=3136725 RepID=UPI0031DB1D51
MKETSRKKFTTKIIISYAVLGLLGLIASYFIYVEVTNYTATALLEENDEKLLMTSSLLTKIYEAENLSKLTLQHFNRKNSRQYLQKVDSLIIKIDSLKCITENEKQQQLLDSVGLLLESKVTNIAQLGKLRTKRLHENPLDSLLQGFTKMEESLGRITPESLTPDFEKLPPERQQLLREYVAFLNENVPKDSTSENYGKKVDSVLVASKALLSKARTESQNIEQGLARSEMALFRTDLELSQKLQRMIFEIDREIARNNYANDIQRRRALTRSIRFAGLMALIGLLVVGIFTFLITRDFLKVQLLKKRLEKEKKYSDSLLKSREQLIATVSHDLRTPLNTISGYTSLLQDTLNSQKHQQYLEGVQSASNYVENLVNDLLEYSKIEAGKIRLRQTDYNLNRLVELTAQENEKLHSKPQVELQLHLDPAFQKNIIGDPLRIKQILSNLIGNAFKFTDSGYVKVTTEAKNTELVAYVEDTGIGIKKSQQETIFKEFSQGDENTEKKYGGYGLGLTISKKLAILLQGDVALTSEEGSGSTFILTLPLQFSEKTASDAVPVHQEQPLSILVIDDDITLSQLIGEMCSQYGHETIIFNDFSTVPKDTDLAYDLVLTDIQMPKINGFQVLSALKSGAYTHYQNQPIIAMTGDRSLPKNEYLKKGFSNVLQKPFSKTTLLKKLSIDALGTEKGHHPPSERIESSKTTEHFNLNNIISFLGNDETALHELLTTFLNETQINIQALEKAVNNDDITGVNKIAHRMLPMMQQLEAKGVIAPLQILENIEKGRPKKELLNNYNDVVKSITALKKELQKQLHQTSS